MDSLWTNGPKHHLSGTKPPSLMGQAFLGARIPLLLPAGGGLHSHLSTSSLDDVTQTQEAHVTLPSPWERVTVQPWAPRTYFLQPVIVLSATLAKPT